MDHNNHLYYFLFFFHTRAALAVILFKRRIKKGEVTFPTAVLVLRRGVVVTPPCWRVPGNFRLFPPPLEEWDGCVRRICLVIVLWRNAWSAAEKEKGKQRKTSSAFCCSILSVSMHFSKPGKPYTRVHNLSVITFGLRHQPPHSAFPLACSHFFTSRICHRRGAELKEFKRTRLWTRRSLCGACERFSSWTRFNREALKFSNFSA